MTRTPELERQIRARRFYHTIDLGDGLVTAGDSSPNEVLSAPGAIPDLRDRSVLDIGAWDGKYSFEAERAGAARVVALDHYVWRLDAAARQAYFDRCEEQGVLPAVETVESGFLLDDTPGKAGFDLLHQFLDSKVEAVVGDFMTMDLGELGSFDVVLYLGVLYHVVNPIAALQRVRQVTGEVAVIETAGTFVPSYPEAALVEFFAGDEMGKDYTNWYLPSAPALRSMCLAAGFRRAEIHGRTEVSTTLPGRLGLHRRKRPFECRIVVHAYP